MENRESIRLSAMKLNELATGAVGFMNTLQKEVEAIKKDLTPEEAAKVDLAWKEAGFDKEREKLTSQINKLDNLFL